MTIEQPNTKITRVWKQIPKHIKITFLVAFVSGLLMHLFMFTNKLPNHDDLAQLIERMDLSGSGRFFLRVPAAISGIFSIPWVNGLLAVFYITVAACFAVAALKIRQSVYCGLLGCLMMVFPTVAVSLTYMQSADAYFFGLMLICIAVYLAGKEKKWHWAVAALLITLSLGCYQAYFGVAVGLMLICLILQMLDVGIPWKKTLFKGIRYLVILGVGMGLYFILAKIMTPADGLTPYMGIDEMGNISLAELPRMIAKAYWYIFNYFILDRRNVHYSFMAVVFALAFLLCAFLMVRFCWSKKIHREPVRLLLLAVFLVLLPLGCNIIYVMSPQDVHMVMIYGTVLILVFLPAVMAAVTDGEVAVVTTADKEVFDKAAADKKISGVETSNKAASIEKTSDKKVSETEILEKGAQKGKTLAALACWVITLSLLLCSFNYFVTDNRIYFKLFLAYEQVDAESSRLVSRIQALPEYSYQTKIVFIGTPYRGVENYRVALPELGYIDMTGAANTLELFSGDLMIRFLERYQNFTQEMKYLPEDTALDRAIREEISTMPQYPAHGSVAFIDGEIYVKFSYQPAQ